MGQRYENILATIGNTPVVKINKLAPANVNQFVKIEAFNPLGPVKGRLALGVIEKAEKSGALQFGQTAFKPHPIQGRSPDFVPKITGDVIDMNVIDKLITIAGPDAMKCARELATKEGISSASRRAPPWPARSKFAKRPPTAPIFFACCPIPASAIRARRCSPKSKPT